MEHNGMLEVQREEKPFDVFVLHTGQGKLVGLKTPARPDPGNNALRLKGCLVEPQMILGRLQSIMETHETYRIRYEAWPATAISSWDKLCSHLDELSYPLPRLVCGEETAQSPDYWAMRAANHASLDNDEIILRDAVCNFLQDHLAPGDIVYDPACSTGAFLAAVKERCQGVYTIGQDLSPEMVRLARQRVDEVHPGNSLRPACAAGTAQAVICRHLNLDVVTSATAKALFRAARQALRSGGLMVVIGHTPILLNSRWMEQEGFDVLNRTGITPSGHAIFQMYVLKKRGPAL